jgi:hypothetical protein
MTPRFFIPAEDDPEKAEAILKSIADFIAAAVPPMAQRIFRVVYQHNGKDMIAEVGKDADLYYRERGPVVAILGSNPFFVCLPNRGVLRGDPIMVGSGYPTRVEYFDPEGGSPILPDSRLAD